MIKAWSFDPKTSPLHTFSHLLAYTKNHLISWRASSATSLDIDIQNIERDIMMLEKLESSANPNSLDDRSLKALSNRHSVLLKQNNIRWAQRAHMLWLKQGGSKL